MAWIETTTTRAICMVLLIFAFVCLTILIYLCSKLCQEVLFNFLPLNTFVVFGCFKSLPVWSSLWDSISICCPYVSFDEDHRHPV